jgi:hypothetical protein
MKRKCIFSLLLMSSVGLVLAQDPSKNGPKHGYFPIGDNTT